jgi:hypothetical protein
MRRVTGPGNDPHFRIRHPRRHVGRDIAKFFVFLTNDEQCRHR